MNKILVVDDDPLVVRTLKNVLEREGYAVEAVKNAYEAVDRGTGADIDLIVCDIRLPQMSGIELIGKVKQMRSEEGKREVPVIFITGYASAEAPDQARDLGGKAYLFKPFDLDSLLEAIRTHLFRRNE
ncbi:MAG: response regulator [Candidatus Omnitrophica bacterium]|nr:response regulator [Candidatus Omnitrophota bacterium]